MTSGTIQILANRHDLIVDTRWTGYSREWRVKDKDGVHLFTTDCYDNLIRRLEEGEGLRVGSYPPKWWPQ